VDIYLHPSRVHSMVLKHTISRSNGGTPASYYGGPVVKILG